MSKNKDEVIELWKSLRKLSGSLLSRDFEEDFCTDLKYLETSQVNSPEIFKTYNILYENLYQCLKQFYRSLANFVSCDDFSVFLSKGDDMKVLMNNVSNACIMLLTEVRRLTLIDSPKPLDFFFTCRHLAIAPLSYELNEKGYTELCHFFMEKFALKRLLANILVELKNIGCAFY